MHPRCRLLLCAALISAAAGPGEATDAPHRRQHRHRDRHVGFRHRLRGSHPARRPRRGATLARVRGRRPTRESRPNRLRRLRLVPAAVSRARRLETIGSEADARAAAAELEAFDPRTLDTTFGRESFYIGRLTDLSGAIDHGRGLLDTAPFPTDRSVLNVIGNGADNFGEDVDAARARILDAGFTLNAVVTDNDPALFSYYRHRVAGGWGAFVLAADPRLDFAAPPCSASSPGTSPARRRACARSEPPFARLTERQAPRAADDAPDRMSGAPAAPRPVRRPEQPQPHPVVIGPRLPGRARTRLPPGGQARTDLSTDKSVGTVANASGVGQPRPYDPPPVPAAAAGRGGRPLQQRHQQDHRREEHPEHQEDVGEGHHRRLLVHHPRQPLQRRRLRVGAEHRLQRRRHPGEPLLGHRRAPGDMLGAAGAVQVGRGSAASC